MIPLPGKIKRAIKNRLKEWRIASVRRVHSFGAVELRAHLERLGVRRGETLLVHSSWNRFEAFHGKVTDLIGALQASVGETGTLLMPTLPFSGSAIEYVKRGGVFDVKRTPSCMGMPSELFRRMPGVLRSVHPTHPVAAWGARAQEMIVGHAACVTPCGVGSPFARLLEADGRILLLGTGIGAMTFFHCAEEILEPDMPFSPFTEDLFTLQSKNAAGEIVETHTRLFKPSVSRRRNLNRVVAPLKRRGEWRQGSLGTLDVILLEARAVLDTLREMLAKGEVCYDD